MKPLFSALLAASLLLAGCSGQGKWSVNGNIDGAAGKTVILESASNGVWSPVDSAKVKTDGSFRFTQAKPQFSDIYRLTIDGRSVYFPIDSLENVTITGSLADFDSRATLAGSPSADLMQAINERIAAATPGDSALNRDIAEMLQPEWGSIVAYYVINKTVGGKPLFDPSVSFDRRIINAVANAYTNGKVGDPRAAMLRDAALAGRRAYEAPAQGQTIEALEIPFLEISFLDKSGKPRSLTEEWEKGQTIILNFTIYGAEESPALNASLAKIYEKYHSRGLEIYQVACDTDEQHWLQTARNLPWVSVYNSPDDNNRTLMRYNIAALPTTFIIDRTGNHFDRVATLDDLDRLADQYTR